MVDLSVSAQTLEVHTNPINGAASGFKARADIVLRDDTADTLTNVSLSATNNDGIITLIDSANADVPAKGERSFTATLTVPPTAHLPGVVLFRASYESNHLRKSIYATLDVKTDGPAKPVEMTLDASADPISQQRPGTLLLQVTNNLDVDVVVTATPRQLSDVKVDPINAWTVAPHSVMANTMAMIPHFRVTPGTHTVVVDITARWTRDGMIGGRQFTLSKPVTVGIFFESELLHALGIPSFLALPGCLCLFTIQLLLSTGLLGVKNQSDLPGYSVTSPGFWILSLSLSAVFLLAYWAVLGVNCLIAYGVMDVGIMWMIGIFVGAALFLVYGTWRKNWIRQHVITSSDTPLEVLRKMSCNGIPLQRSVVTFQINGAKTRGFTLENVDDAQTMVWVSPHISVDWCIGPTQAEQDRANDAQTQFNNIMNGDRNLTRLVALFENPATPATLKFDFTPAVPKPLHLKLEAITGAAADDLIVG